MLDREQIETFVTVVDERSFGRAAAVLNITRGAVSHRIKALETSLATVLLVRDKPIMPTAAGEILMHYVRSLRLLEQASLAQLMPQVSSAGPVPLAIAVNADSLATWISPLLWPLLADRRIALEVIADDQSHTLRRLARGEVTGCVSTESKPVEGFVADRLGAMEYRCYASTAFARAWCSPQLSIATVLKAPAILFDRKDSLHDGFLARVFGFSVERYPKHYLPSPEALLEAVTNDVGYALLPTIQVRSKAENAAPDAATALVDLAPDHPTLVPLYWHHWRSEPPLSQEITRLVVEGARCALVDPPERGEEHEAGGDQAGEQ